MKGEAKNISKGWKCRVSFKGRSYDVILHADTRAGSYWLSATPFSAAPPGGDTVEEAPEMIKDAIEGHLDVVAEKKKKRVAA